jgi:hypothetical protein
MNYTSDSKGIGVAYDSINNATAVYRSSVTTDNYDKLLQDENSQEKY